MRARRQTAAFYTIFLTLIHQYAYTFTKKGLIFLQLSGDCRFISLSTETDLLNDKLFWFGALKSRIS